MHIKLNYKKNGPGYQVIFVSFYTIGTIYEELFHTHLLPSLEKFNLDYWIEPIENKGRWGLNTIQKPAVILRAMIQNTNVNLMWVDVDAIINEYPSLVFDLPRRYDIGVHYLKWLEHYGRPVVDTNKIEMLDGSIFVRNKPEMIEFIRLWKAKSTDVGINHQKVLENLLKENPQIGVYNLPREYCYITSTPEGSLPAIQIEKPIISHYQASRIAKRHLYGIKKDV